MALGYASCTMAGVDLAVSGVPFKTLLLDGGNLQSEIGGVNIFAADGTCYTQILIDAKGQKFGVKLEFADPTILNNLITAINSAIATGDGSFDLVIQDDLHDFELTVKPDFDAGWISYPEQRTSPVTVKGIVLRLITV